MSRWGRGRGGSVAVPLDSALFRENSNCPSAARSAGTVGKWGITSFTSIRSAPYAYANAAPKKSVQDQNSPLTVPTFETEQAPPKPKKFFKSRNAELLPPVPQITYAPPVPAAPLSPEHSSHVKEKKSVKRSRAYNRDSISPELPRRNLEKTKSRKISVSTKASKKEDSSGENAELPNKRYLVRNRNKVINYAEDGSNSPIPDFANEFESLPPPPPKIPTPKTSPIVTSPHPAITDIASPSTSREPIEEKKPPPIVLRISKGTSRIVSTDSNEGLTSPSSDRHSSVDRHSDFSSEAKAEIKKSPVIETICSPKHEGLKITIKCPGLSQEVKKEKKKDKKDSHKSHKRHHKNSDDEPLKKASSPLPGTDTYELYRTLTSPIHDADSESKKQTLDDIELQLAKLDSTEPVSKSTKQNIQPTEPPPEPKPPEVISGRARRNRPNVNYSENDDYLDAVTSKSLPGKSKTVTEVKRETKKGKKKTDSIMPEATAMNSQPDIYEGQTEKVIDKNELIGILSGSSDNGALENDSHKSKYHKKHRHKHTSKQSSPENKCDVEYPEEQSISESDVVQENPQKESPEQVMSSNESEGNSQTTAQSVDSAYTSLPNELPEEETQKSQVDEMFKSPREVSKSPHGMSDDNHIEEKPSVKLVITKKKGSIFKSKSLVNENCSPLPARKRRHLYRHEWANDKGNETPRPEPPENPEPSNPVARPMPEEFTRVTRYRAPDPVNSDFDSAEAVKPYSSVKCAKEAKEYYTVVRNVKKAHQIQEIGEFQEFNDDVEYLLDALQDNNPISTRCLSAITLASKCTAPAFRMHLRAHGTVQKFFSALHDATNDQSLGLCTATVMFVLSQDRLNMDLDRESLELMLNLLESDVSHKNALDDCGLTSVQLAKTQEKVRELCTEIKNAGKATHLDLDNITIGHLAMETLLSLTSKRAGEWFKEELRVLGGVDHIVRTIQDCATRLESSADTWDAADIDVLRKADRCMRVLENVTQMNEENQLYLVSEKLGAAATLVALYRRTVGEAQRVTSASRREPLLDAALPATKVLINLSHCFHPQEVSVGAQVVGEQSQVMEMCLTVLDNPGNFIPDAKNFEFSVCVLMLLINLVQKNEVNTQRLLDVKLTVNDDEMVTRTLTALDFLVELFYKRDELARRAEENTDALLDGEKDGKRKKKHSQDDIDETVAKLLARAGTHMEHTMVCAYVALLIGHAALSGEQHAQAVAIRLPTFHPLLPTLRKYYEFLNLTASAESAIVAHVKSTHRIIQYMEECDRVSAPEVQSQQAPAPYTNTYPNYYQTSPSDVPQDMSLSSLNYTMNNSYSSSSSDRMSSSLDTYRWQH